MGSDLHAEHQGGSAGQSDPWSRSSLRDHMFESGAGLDQAARKIQVGARRLSSRFRAITPVAPGGGTPAGPHTAGKDRWRTAV